MSTQFCSRAVWGRCGPRNMSRPHKGPQYCVRRWLVVAGRCGVSITAPKVLRFTGSPGALTYCPKCVSHYLRGAIKCSTTRARTTFDCHSGHCTTLLRTKQIQTGHRWWWLMRTVGLVVEPDCSRAATKETAPRCPATIAEFHRRRRNQAKARCSTSK